MNTRLVNSAAGVVMAALQQNRTAAGIALALDSAGMLQLPETAELQATNDALRARLAELEGQRAVLAERLRAGQTWERGRLAGENLVSQSELREIFGIPLAAPLNGAEADGITRLTVPVQVLRAEVEDRHDSPLHHTYRVPRDLPAPDGAQ